MGEFEGAKPPQGKTNRGYLCKADGEIYGKVRLLEL